MIASPAHAVMQTLFDQSLVTNTAGVFCLAQ